MYTKEFVNWSPFRSTRKLEGIFFCGDKVVMASGLLTIAAIALSPFVWSDPPLQIDLHHLVPRAVAILALFVTVFLIVREERRIAGDKWLKQAVDTIADLPIAITIIDKKGKIVFANHHLCKTLGLSENRVVKTPISDYLQNERGNDFLKWLQKPGGKFTAKLKIFGSHDHFRVTVHPQSYLFQNKQYYVANIELSEELELSLQKHKDFINTYETVIKSTRNIIWNYNFETNESHYNDTIFTLFGYTPEEVRTNPNWWADNIHPEDKARVLGRMEQSLEGNTLTWNAEYRFRCANGSYKIVEDYGFINRDEVGKPRFLRGFMTDVTEQKHLQKQLHDEELRHQTELGRAISNAQEAERKSISEELHDNVCQILGGAKLMLEHCVNNNVYDIELLKSVTVHLNASIVELRQMAHSLSPYFVEEFGLVNGIRELTSFIESYGKTKVVVDVVEFDEGMLSNSQKLLLYRITQEQLNNIVKHAKATEIRINLYASGNWCQFSIQDNGAGVNFNDKKKGFGLKNIQNRVQLLNGEVQFTSAPGKGFLLEVRFNIN